MWELGLLHFGVHPPSVNVCVPLLPPCSALAEAQTEVSNFPWLGAFVLHRLNPVIFLPGYLLELFMLLQLLSVPQPPCFHRPLPLPTLPCFSSLFALFCCPSYSSCFPLGGEEALPEEGEVQAGVPMSGSK